MGGGNDDVLSEYFKRANTALANIKRTREKAAQRDNILLAELEVLRAENEKLWGTVRDQLQVPTSSEGTVRRRDSLRMRRSSLRLSFRESRRETPRERLQELPASIELRTKINAALSEGTAIDMWTRSKHKELHLLIANRGVAKEVTITAEQDDGQMLVFWGKTKGVQDKQ